MIVGDAVHVVDHLPFIFWSVRSRAEYVWQELLAPKMRVGSIKDAQGQRILYDPAIFCAIYNCL